MKASTQGNTYFWSKIEHWTTICTNDCKNGIDSWFTQSGIGEQWTNSNSIEENLCIAKGKTIISLI
jgi:hypothetical protein